MPTSQTKLIQMVSGMAFLAVALGSTPAGWALGFPSDGVSPSTPRGLDNRCVVWFRLTSAVEVSNLDFVVNYGPADGSFLGEGADVECARAVGGNGLVAFRDRDIDGVREFKGSVIRLNNFNGPVDLAACRWIFNDDPPQVTDFSTIVTNAARRDGESGDFIDLRPLPGVRVDRVECPGMLPNGLTTTTTTTTTGVSTSSTLSTSTTLPTGSGDCGVPSSEGPDPKASDALFALQVAVGLRDCALCVCDVDNSGQVAASDALEILRAAVGSGEPLNCPDCSQ